jgi:NhaB family Na+:H+ antiporter
LGPLPQGGALSWNLFLPWPWALKSYPLQPGGLLALEAVLIGMAKPETVYDEALNNFQVILLLIFMVVGIYFMKDVLLFILQKFCFRHHWVIGHCGCHSLE